MDQVWFDIILQDAKKTRPYVEENIGGVVFSSSDYKEVTKYLVEHRPGEGLIYLVYRDSKLMLERM